MFQRPCSSTPSPPSSTSPSPEHPPSSQDSYWSVYTPYTYNHLITTVMYKQCSIIIKCRKCVNCIVFHRMFLVRKSFKKCNLFHIMHFTISFFLTLSPSYRPVPPSQAPPLTGRNRLPGLPLLPASNAFNEDSHRRPLTPCWIDPVIAHIKR